MPKSDLEEVYIMHEAVVDAETLSPFVRNATVARCTILGLEQLHTAVTSRASANIDDLKQQYYNKLQRYNFSLKLCMKIKIIKPTFL